VHSIRAFAKNLGNPYYEPTIVVHDIRSADSCRVEKVRSYNLLQWSTNYVRILYVAN